MSTQKPPVTWGDLASFDEMYDHICEHHSGFDLAQMSLVRVWMHAAMSWERHRLTNELFDLKRILGDCWRDGVDSCRFDAEKARENRLAIESALKLPLCDS